MRVRACIVLMGLLSAVAGGAGQTPSPAAPTLSTSDKIAISDAEKAKQDAQAAYNKAQEIESTVIREWNAGHPGFHLDEKTFVVTRDAPRK